MSLANRARASGSRAVQIVSVSPQHLSVVLERKSLRGVGLSLKLEWSRIISGSMLEYSPVVEKVALLHLWVGGSEYPSCLESLLYKRPYD